MEAICLLAGLFAQLVVLRAYVQCLPTEPFAILEAQNQKKNFVSYGTVDRQILTEALK